MSLPCRHVPGALGLCLGAREVTHWHGWLWSSASGAPGQLRPLELEVPASGSPHPKPSTCLQHASSAPLRCSDTACSFPYLHLDTVCSAPITHLLNSPASFLFTHELFKSQLRQHFLQRPPAPLPCAPIPWALPCPSYSCGQCLVHFT